MHLRFEPTPAQRAAAALAPAEEILYASPYDQDRAGGFCDGFAVFTPQRGVFLTGDGREEIAWDETSATEQLYFRIEQAKKVMSTFETLNYRERAIVADHLGFCMDCYGAEYLDEFDLDEHGKPKRKKKKPAPFIELAVDHGLASPDTADKIYRRALEKMRKQLQKQD